MVRPSEDKGSLAGALFRSSFSPRTGAISRVRPSTAVTLAISPTASGCAARAFHSSPRIRTLPIGSQASTTSTVSPTSAFGAGADPVAAQEAAPEQHLADLDHGGEHHHRDADRGREHEDGEQDRDDEQHVARMA